MMGYLQYQLARDFVQQEFLRALRNSTPLWFWNLLRSLFGLNALGRGWQ